MNFIAKYYWQFAQVVPRLLRLRLLMNFIAKYYWQFAKTADKGQSIFLLLIRLYIGYQCIISGHGHLENFDAMVKNFRQWGIPLPRLSVAVSASSEIIFGALLLVGFASRLAALVLTANFFVAMLSVELANFGESWHKLAAMIWEDQSPIISDTAFPFLATALIVLLFGPGWFSLDGLIRWWRTYGSKKAGLAGVIPRPVL